MKRINREINQIVESVITGVTFKVKNDDIELCLISFSDSDKIGPAKKIIVNRNDIPEELLVALDKFVDERIDQEIIADTNISVIQNPIKTKKSKKKG